ncbi:uncharacterized protein LOC144652616 [Oculina patagonica]
MERGSHLLLFLLFLEMTNTEAFADEDGSQRSRSAYVVTKPNKQSNGHVVKRFVSPSLLSCSHLCMRNKWCTSTNFNLFSKNNSKGTCELLNAFSFMDGTQFHEEKGATFAMLLKDPCQTNPCQNNGDCVPYFASNTYHCSCKAGFAGAHCEEAQASTSHSATASISQNVAVSSNKITSVSPSESQSHSSTPSMTRGFSAIKTSTSKSGSLSASPWDSASSSTSQNISASQSSFSCPSAVAGLYADPNDCSKYIKCHYGQETRESCPQGNLFNPNTKQCDWQHNVDCT